MPSFRLAPLLAALAWPTFSLASGSQPSLPGSTFAFGATAALAGKNLPFSSYTAGNLGLRIEAFSSAGKPASVNLGSQGLGVNTGLWDAGALNSTALQSPGDVLWLTFSEPVVLSSVLLSGWDNGLLADHATLSWGGGGSIDLDCNDQGLIKVFALSGAVGTSFKLQAVGALSSFRLAGVNASAASIPEPDALALLGLGLGALAWVGRRAGQRQRV